MSHEKSAPSLLQGFRDGIPIGLGYLSVSFSVGLLAVSKGISALAAIILSATNLTSAGEVAGIDVIAALGSITEMILVQLVINMRYALMSISLSQKLTPDFSTGHRMIAAFGMTDEIFAVASARSGPVSPKYMYGLMIAPIVGWTLGTAIGALAGDVLPMALRNALGIAIYGMFLAIVIPPARKEKSVLFAAGLAVALSCIMHYIPALDSAISDGFKIIIATLFSAGIAAAVFPMHFDQEEGDAA